MRLSFTDINTGATIILLKDNIAAAYKGDDFPQIITTSDVVYDLGDTWDYVVEEITGQPPPIGAL